MSLKKFAHVILTKFNTQPINDRMLYDNPTAADWWMDRRMKLFEKTKDSVLSQKGDFKWIISLDVRTPERYVAKIATDSRIYLTSKEAMRALEGWNLSAEYVITSRIDNDDQYLPGFVEEIQGRFEPEIKAIDVRYLMLEVETGKIYKDLPRYSCSMFVSLIEPVGRVMTVFCRPHGQVASGYPTSGSYDAGLSGFANIKKTVIEKDLAVMVCHANNVTNHITGSELNFKELPRTTREHFKKYR